MATTAVTALSFGTPNIQATTREVWNKSIRDQVLLRNIMLAKLTEFGRVVKKRVAVIRQPISTARLDTLVQPFAYGQPMNSAKQSFLAAPWWGIKRQQIPIVRTLEEELNNNAVDQPIDLAKAIVDASQKGLRTSLAAQMYGFDLLNATVYDSTDDDGTTRASLFIQSMRQALSHTLTYGHQPRTTTADKVVWAGGSIAGSFSDSGTAYSASIKTFRDCIDTVMQYASGPSDLMAICGKEIFRAIQSQAEAKGSGVVVKTGDTAKYGYEYIEIDGVMLVKDLFLNETRCTGASTMFFMLNMPDWEFRMHPLGDMTISPFVFQGDRSDSVYEWLARAYLFGNLVCYKPNGSIYLSNMA